jgi:hypothetical protein
MDSVMTPLAIRVKGRTVEDLAQPLYEWVQDSLPAGTALVSAVKNAPDSAKSYMKDIARLLDETLVTSKKGTKTVADYLDYASYYRSPLQQSVSFEDFTNRLITEIGRMLKNQTFIELAAQEGYADSAFVRQEIQVWEQKWTYDVYRGHLVKEIQVTEEEMHDYFENRWRELDIADVDTTRFYKYENEVYNAILHEKHIHQLESEIEGLRERYPVWINESLLNELELSDGPKSLQTSVYLRKNFSGEAFMPTADMKWLHF